MLGFVQDTVHAPMAVSASLAVVLLLCGLAGLLLGGHGLVEGASALARRTGVSPLMIGLTIVAMGTSSPELALNLYAVSASPEGALLAWGNVIGSNMANIGLVLGVACLIRPLRVRGQVLWRDLPLLQLVTCVFIVLVLLPLGSGTVTTLTPLGGFVLLGMFVAILCLWIRTRKGSTPSGDINEAPEPEHRSLPAALALLLGGLVLLLGGAWATEFGAVDIARHLHISEAIIGLTIVAVATSLPELVTAIIAARRNQCHLAIGTVIGSNLFNLVLVMGASSLIHDIPMPRGGGSTLLAMAGFTMALLWVYTPQRKLGRTWGVVVLLSWIGALIWSAFASGGS
jgi:cation:H+ antiporter